jgi:hypothetical protein
MAGEWSGQWESKISPAVGYCRTIRWLRSTHDAACDLRVKNAAIPANASQCDHLGLTPIAATEEKLVLNDPLLSITGQEH